MEEEVVEEEVEGEEVEEEVVEEEVEGEEAEEEVEVGKSEGKLERFLRLFLQPGLFGDPRKVRKWRLRVVLTARSF